MEVPDSAESGTGRNLDLIFVPKIRFVNEISSKFRKGPDLGPNMNFCKSSCSGRKLEISAEISSIDGLDLFSQVKNRFESSKFLLKFRTLRVSGPAFALQKQVWKFEISAEISNMSGIWTSFR